MSTHNSIRDYHSENPAPFYLLHRLTVPISNALHKAGIHTFVKLSELTNAQFGDKLSKSDATFNTADFPRFRSQARAICSNPTLDINDVVEGWLDSNSDKEAVLDFTEANLSLPSPVSFRINIYEIWNIFNIHERSSYMSMIYEDNVLNLQIILGQRLPFLNNFQLESLVNELTQLQPWFSENLNSFRMLYLLSTRQISFMEDGFTVEGLQEELEMLLDEGLKF